ncbi:amidase domain-containing protein [Schinkia sp. CFF1]
MSTWVEELEQLVNCRLTMLVGNNMRGRHRPNLILNEKDELTLENTKSQLKDRKSQIVKATANGQIISQKELDGFRFVDYIVHHQYLIKQPKDKFYIEESIEQRQAIVKNNKLIKDIVLELGNKGMEEETEGPIRLEDVNDSRDNRQKYNYDRRAAVQYAENWWNSYNPKYKRFKDNCTNFISQCIHEGGIPMTAFGNRNKGWWYSGSSWSYSWTVANSFRWHLSGAKQGILAQEVASVTDLILGDLICYDFEGDGRWNHNTIVVAKDANNEPLVNAQTYNSRMRYWAYRDSTAYTPNIKYKFFHILDRR